MNNIRLDAVSVKFVSKIRTSGKLIGYITRLKWKWSSVLLTKSFSIVIICFQMKFPWPHLRPFYTSIMIHSQSNYRHDFNYRAYVKLIFNKSKLSHYIFDIFHVSFYWYSSPYRRVNVFIFKWRKKIQKLNSLHSLSVIANFLEY